MSLRSLSFEWPFVFCSNGFCDCVKISFVLSKLCFGCADYDHLMEQNPVPFSSKNLSTWRTCKGKGMFGLCVLRSLLYWLCSHVFLNFMALIYRGSAEKKGVYD
jgi:hypothetical protein